MDSFLEIIDEFHQQQLALAEEQHAALRQAVLSHLEGESLDAKPVASPIHDPARLQLSATQLTSQPALQIDDPDPCPCSPVASRGVHHGCARPRASNLRGWLSLSSKAESEKMLPKVAPSAKNLDPMARRLRCLDRAAAILLFLNGVCMMVELELEGRAAAETLSNSDTSHCFFLACPGELHSLGRLIAGMFDLLFFLELLARLALEKGKVYMMPAIWFDAILAIAGMVHLVFIIVIEVGEVTAGAPIMYTVVVVRALRAIRLLRVLRFCRGLRMFLSACKTFLTSLVWAMVLLGIFLSTSALIIGNMLQHYITDPMESLEMRTWMWDHYGTAYNAAYTFFEVTFAGNWPTNVRPVLDNVSKLYVLFFGAYIIVVVFALVRVITAIFLRDTLEAAQSDAEFMVMESLRKRARYVQKLENIFKAIDKTGKGMVTEARLNDMLSDPSVKAHFQSIDVDIHEGVALFHLLDNGDGEVTLEEFVDGILRCKGQARAIDQVALHAELKQLDTKLSRMTRIFTQVYPTLLRKSAQAAKSPTPQLGVMRRLSMASMASDGFSEHQALAD
mmetsp:Transcript_38293/g.89993  ORF Transcript_38293/g.89993 Transcript_38293/m.89993 type:complete len:562 (-) Transcript_38293:124-1809(-)